MLDLDMNKPEDQVRMLEILLTSAILGNGGRIELTRTNTSRVMAEGLFFDFNTDPNTDNGVLTLKEPSADAEAEAFMRALLTAAGLSEKEINETLAEMRKL